MRGIKAGTLKWICQTLGFSVLFMLNLIILFELRSNIQLPGRAQIFWEEDFLSYHSLERIQNKDQNLVLQAYSNSEKKQVIMPELTREIEAQWVRVYPSSQDTINQMLMKGSYILEKKECVVDTGIAQELFASYNVVGEEIWLEENVYTIAGVVEGNKEAIYYERGEGQLFSTLIIDFKESLNAKQQVESFLMAYSLPSPTAVLYTDEWEFLINFLIRLPIVVLVGISLVGILGVMRGEEHLKSILGLLTQLVLIGLTVGFCFYLLRGDMPQSLIPSKWSEPKFYTSLVERLKNDLVSLPTLGENIGAQVLLGHCLKLVGYNILNFVLCVGMGCYLCRRIKSVFKENLKNR